MIQLTIVHYIIISTILITVGVAVVALTRDGKKASASGGGGSGSGGGGGGDTTNETCVGYEDCGPGFKLAGDRSCSDTGCIHTDCCVLESSCEWVECDPGKVKSSTTFCTASDRRPVTCTESKCCEADTTLCDSIDCGPGKVRRTKTHIGRMSGLKCLDEKCRCVTGPDSGKGSEPVPITCTESQCCEDKRK